MSHRLIPALFVVLLICFSAPAQVAGPSPTPEENDRAAMRKKAVDLLTTVAGQIDSIRSTENRVRMASNAADLLWDEDEKRARSLFAAVAEDIRSGFRESDFDSLRGSAPTLFKLRVDTITRIVKHDPELALEFLRTTRLPPNAKVPPYLMGINEQALELRLAAQVAAKSPQLALKLGRESLANGFSNELLTFLTELRRSDKEKSLTFYKEIVDKLRGAELLDERSGIQTALMLIRSFEPPDADEEVYRDLLGIVLTKALANGCVDAKVEDGPQICYEVGPIFPKLEKYYGLRAAPLKRWVEDESDVEAAGWWGEVRGVMENGTVDEILALAPKHPDMQSQIYWAALMKARAAGDMTKTRQIAAEFPEESARAELITQIDRELRWEAISADKPSLVQQELTRLPTDHERIEFLFRLATQAGERDRQAALGLLTQAGYLIDSLKLGREQVEAQVFLALMFCSLKSDRAFAIIERLIPRLNELVAAATTLDGFDVRYISDGEWNMSGQGQLGTLLSSLADNAGVFAALDFDRSVNLAGQLDRPELRLMADLKIAQGILTNRINAPQAYLPNR